MGRQEPLELEPIRLVHPSVQGGDRYPFAREIEELNQAAVVGLDGAVGPKERDAERIALKEPLVESLRLPLGVARLEEVEVLALQDLALVLHLVELLADEARLELGKGLYGDESQQLVRRVDDGDVLVEFPLPPRKREV